MILYIGVALITAIVGIAAGWSAFWILISVFLTVTATTMVLALGERDD